MKVRSTDDDHGLPYLGTEVVWGVAADRESESIGGPYKTREQAIAAAHIEEAECICECRPLSVGLLAEDAIEADDLVEFRRHSNRWSMQYESEADAGVERWHLEELK